jgi:hypothetical protein
MGHARKFSRGDYVGMMLTTLAAIPDFSWSAATTGDVADDGYCVVVVMVILGPRACAFGPAAGPQEQQGG